MNLGLHGHSVLVTGATGVIGSAICHALAASGAQPVVHHNTNREAALQLAKDTGGIAMEADLSQPHAAARLVREAESKVGPIGGCIFSAGTWPGSASGIVDLSEERWVREMYENVMLTVRPLRAFLELIRRTSRPRASVVLVGATSGSWGNAERADFAAAKAALEHGVLPSLAAEIAKLSDGGRANMVIPGAVVPPDANTQGGVAGSGYLLDRLPHATDVAQTAIFLLSGRAGATTGETVRVDAGQVAPPDLVG